MSVLTGARRATLSVAVLMLALTGCGQADQTSEPQQRATREGVGASGPSMNPSPTPVHIEGNPAPQKVRKPFIFELEEESEGADEALTQLTITVTTVECGFKGFGIPADESTGEAAYDLWAPQGTRYCRVDIAVVNSGKRTVQFTPGGEMFDTADNQFMYEDNATHAVANGDRVGQFGGNTIELRPGQRGRTVVVFAINIGSAPAYVLIATEGVVENIDEEQRWARVDIGPNDVKWFHLRGE